MLGQAASFTGTVLAAGDQGAMTTFLDPRSSQIGHKESIKDTARVLGGGAATAVGATGIGPSVMTLRQYPDLVDRAAAAGRVTYCWTVDDPADLLLCRDLGVDWVGTNVPARALTVLDGATPPTEGPADGAGAGVPSEATRGLPGDPGA